MAEKPARNQKQLVIENADLLARLDEAEETLRAIRSSEVDALIVPGVGGEQVYTLKGADYPYRVLIEAMSEGALTLTQDGMILYANQRMAEMLKMPLEKVIGSSLQTWIAPESKHIIETLLGNDAEKERRLQIDLSARDGTRVSVSLSISKLLVDERPVSFCLVATDLTEQKRSDEIRASEKLARELLAAANQSRRALLSVVEDQRRTEGALSASESELRALFASMQDAVLVIDREGFYLKIAPTNIGSNFLPPHELLGKNLKDIFPAEQAEIFYGVIQQVLNTKQSTQIEYELIFDHQSVWYQASVSPKNEDSTLWVARDITEHKRRENILRESERNLKNSQQIAHLGSWQLDVATNQVMWTEEIFHIFGYDPALPTPPFTEHIKLFTPASWERLSASIANTRETGNPYVLELETVKKDGSNGWLWVRGEVTRNSDGNTIGLWGTAQDITERKLADQSLRLQSAALNAAANAIMITTIDGTIEWINQAYTILTGYTSEEVVGRNPRELVKSGKHAQDFYKQMWDTILTGEVWFSTLINRRKDGSLYTEEQTITPLKNSDGKISHFIAIKQDISERVRRENTLRESERNLNNSQQIAHLGSWQLDVATNQVLWTEELYHMYGFDPALPVPPYTEHMKLFTPASWESLSASLTNTRETGIPYVLELETVKKDGSNGWMWVRGEVTKDPDGNTIGLWGAAQDITERKQREEEIKTRNEELSALYTLSRLLADAQDLESVIALVVRHAVESIHITFACMALLEKGFLVRRKIHPVRLLDHVFDQVDIQSISSLPFCQAVLDKNEPVTLQAGNPEISSIERTTLLLDFAQSVCLVPLRVGVPLHGNSNPPLGLLILGEAREQTREPFTTEKIQLARSIGDQAASAIRRMLAIEQANLRLQRIASLREIDSAIAKSFDLRLSLEVILKHVREQLAVDAADVLVVNTNLQKMEFKAGRGFRTRAMERVQLRLGEGQAGKAAFERRMVQIPDVAANPAVFALPELLKNEQISAYIAVPLIIKGQVNGVLEIFQRTPLEPDDEWFDFLNTLAGQTAIAIDNDRLFNGLQRSNLELGLAYDATIEGWSHALDLRDKETEGHTLRVTEMTVKLAESFNIPNDALKQVRWGGLLHDIGKMGVPDGILLKPGPLTDDEWIVMKKHPVFAYEMLMPIHYLKDALDIPYCHHEKWDGTGYPRGLKGEQIPLAARIFAVVDVWDALTSDRPYRKAWTKEKALEYIKTESGTHFDPQVVDTFLRLHAGL